METLAKWLMAWCERRGKVFKITGTGGPDDVYLIRYYVLQSRWCNIFLHQFLRSDRDDMHDHPWNFATYLIKGSYLEKRWNPKTQSVEETYRANHKENEVVTPAIKKNTLVFRKATDLHQVLVFKDLKEWQKAQAALTLFVSGPTKREWGFVKEEYVHYGTVGGNIRTWIAWRDYLGLPPETPGRG